ncbi:MAG: glutamine-synthetase adenylyltransferase, partial [Alphaproteobacteria bacterium]
MHVFSLLDAITDSHHMPQPFDRDQAAARTADLLAAAKDFGGDVHHAIAAMLADERGRNLLQAVFGNSPFLSRLALRSPDFLSGLIQAGPSRTMAAISEALQKLAQAGLPLPDLARQLRILRGQAALCIAMADISGIWDLSAVTGALSEFARNILRCTVDALLLSYAQPGEFMLADPAHPSQHCGYVIIAMGKLGACELNYSSDIDLIVLFDPESPRYSGRRELPDFQVRFTKALVGLLQDFTGDGYVFRVDLRLRPDPGATPIALSVEFAETYYESAGKGWERAAMIKARPVAGDIELGRIFLERISPFIWRRNLDFAAIRDVYEMVGLIRSHHGHAGITAPGHNIKLGMGGIREIEFFAQTHQLIAGGRDRKLRDPTTLGIIALLQENGQLEPDAAGQLCEAYIFLRTLEHRLQMIDDEQTQTLPKSPEGLKHLAMFMGYDGTEAFGDAVRQHLENAAAQFQKLIGQGKEGEPGPNEAAQDFTSRASLQHLGFTEPDRAGTIIETWKSFRYRALRRSASSGRALLTPYNLCELSHG